MRKHIMFINVTLILLLYSNSFAFLLTISALPTISDSDTVVFEKFELNVVIYETLAEVNVTGLFYNSADESTTGYFTIDIPIGSYVSNISLQSNNFIYWGRIMEIQEAQEAFVNATKSNRSAVLLTQIGECKFKVEFSIEAESKIQITLTYYKRIIRLKGHYDLNINLESILEQSPQSFSVNYAILSPIRSIEDVITPNGADIIYHSSHYVSVILSNSNLSVKSFNLRYFLNGAEFGSNIVAYNNGTNEFFLATFSPSLNELRTDGLAKDFVFLIDVSGSMSGDKIDQAKTALLYIIDQLHIEDRFSIISFSQDITAASQELMDRSNSNSVSYAKGWIAALSASGSTNIHDALLTGLGFFKSSERSMILVLLTDGRPTTGLTNTQNIEEEFLAANNLGVSLFTLGFGTDVNFQFLGQLARQNAGEAFKIEENLNAGEEISSFYDSVSTPILKDIRLRINSGVVNNVVYPYFIPNLFDGSELFLVGERKDSKKIDLTITGVSSIGELDYHIRLSSPSSTNSKDDWIEKTWAIAKIDDLLRGIKFGVSGNDTIEAVISMALFYGIITPYTAMFIDTKSDDEALIIDEYDSEEKIYAGKNNQPQREAAALAAFRDSNKSTSGFQLFFTVVTLLSMIGILKYRNKHS